MVTSRAPVSEEAKKAGSSFLTALEILRALEGNTPILLGHVIAFIHVAIGEGRGVGEYAADVGVSKSVMSRYILDLGVHTRHMKEGFGLLMSRPNPMELRKHEVFLTPHGRATFNKVVRAWALSA